VDTPPPSRLHFDEVLVFKDTAPISSSFCPPSLVRPPRFAFLPIARPGPLRMGLESGKADVCKKCQLIQTTPFCRFFPSLICTPTPPPWESSRGPPPFVVLYLLTFNPVHVFVNVSPTNPPPTEGPQLWTALLPPSSTCIFDWAPPPKSYHPPPLF